MKLKLLCIALIYAFSMKSYAGVNVENGNCSDCSPARIGAVSQLMTSKMQQTFSMDALNLKSNISTQNSVRQTASAISISQADDNAISTIGNSWLSFQGGMQTFSMNIGTANNATPQTWALPTNFMTNFSKFLRTDFISPSSVPAALKIAGANKVIKSYYLDNTNRPMSVYDHYNMTATEADHLGTSYDLEVGTDQNFNEPDYEFVKVPLNLGDAFSSTIDAEDYVTQLTLTRAVESMTVDAYGTIATPDGTFNCLRITYVTQNYTRPNQTTDWAFQSTKNGIGFITEQGYFFYADVSATSGTANLSNFSYRKVVATAALTNTNDIKLNNDSNGVSINVDNSAADKSAILDIKNDSLGILIPRIAKANRPKTPATGLLVYQIDNTPGFYYFDGSG